MRLLCLSITYSGLPQTWELHTRTKVRQVTRLITIVDSVWWSQWGTCGTCGTSCFPVALSSLQRRGSIAAHMASKEKTREELSVRGLDTGCWWMYAKRFSRWIIFRLYMLLCSLSFSVFELTAVRFTHRSLALVACKISIQTSTAEVFPTLTIHSWIPRWLLQSFHTFSLPGGGQLCFCQQLRAPSAEMQHDGPSWSYIDASTWSRLPWKLKSVWSKRVLYFNSNSFCDWNRIRWWIRGFPQLLDSSKLLQYMFPRSLRQLQT